jgi:hypothetical protein
LDSTKQHSDNYSLQLCQQLCTTVRDGLMPCLLGADFNKHVEVCE